MDIVLFGIQGSGKGTIAKAIADNFNFHYFETGAELRKLAQEDSELGRKVKEITEAGNLVPNEIVMEIIENFMNNAPSIETIIFDGIPRKQEQASTFNELMDKHERNFMCILVDVPEEEALKRLTTRRICSKCKTVYPADYKEESCEKCSGELITRSDDNPESIKTRIQAYYDETMPVINTYKANNKLLELDGVPPIPEVRDSAIQLIQEKIL